MQDLYNLWGQGIALYPAKSLCTLVISQKGSPDGSWPEPGTRITCNSNRNQPEMGQLWWVSWDDGTFFLEELVDRAEGQ